jgi:hypothetical protein
VANCLPGHPPRDRESLQPLDQQICDLESLLASGAESVTVDGVTTRFNLAMARQRLRELCRQRDRKRNPFLTIRQAGGYDGY